MTDNGQLTTHNKPHSLLKYTNDMTAKNRFRQLSYSNALNNERERLLVSPFNRDEYKRMTSFYSSTNIQQKSHNRKNRKHNTMMETQKDSAKKSHGRTTLINDSAIAERLCNALWLSVDSFNSTITQAKFFSSKVTSASDSPARTIQCCSAVFGVTSNLAVTYMIHGRPWLCTARDHAWSVSHCTQSQMILTAYSACYLVPWHP